MAKKKGEKYRCDVCGLVVVVQDPCECDASCELVCCEMPMEQVKTSSKTAAPKVPKSKK